MKENIKQVADTTSAGIQQVADTTTQAVDQVSQKAGSLSDFSMDKLQGFFELAEKVMAQYGGEAVNLGLNVLRVDAFSQIIFPLVAVPTLIYVFYKSWNYKVMDPSILFSKKDILKAISVSYGRRTGAQDTMLRKVFKLSSTDIPQNSEEHIEKLGDAPLQVEKEVWVFSKLDDGLQVAVSIIYPSLTFVLTISIYKLVNLWAWVGIFYPELYAVNKLVLQNIGS